MFKVEDQNNDFVAYTNSIEEVNKLKKWLVETFGEYGADGIKISEINGNTDLITLYDNYAKSEGFYEE